ncbi:MAG: sulfatase-like hydrolase/transferase [Kiritimatiellae bacterium]|nr:sulfatase-like hydrolase/transferase [Kiritimatiellia bacterium]
MNRRTVGQAKRTVIAGAVVMWGAIAAAAPRPNVLIFFVDDMGWAQPSCYGGRLVPTPHMDSIASNGVRFTQGYVSGCICSPSRVGLMTGRYQARTGHDANCASGDTEAGRERALAAGERTIAERLKAAGYVTGLIGKWHLGAAREHLPASRGFDESFGTSGNIGEGGGFFFRGHERVPDPPEAPITSPLYAREAGSFIRRHADRPWCLYVPFNAVHSPVVAREETLRRFADRPRREQAYAAMLTELDEAIGEVLGALRSAGVESNTLVFCISDNGGASLLAEMGGLRGRKWLLYEGGIRVTWLVQWPGRIPGGRVLDVPVIQLDVLPTALAAAGVPIQPEWQLDGVNLLPLLEGKTDRLDREALYWRFGVQFAVRRGDWKLVKAGLNEPVRLFNLKEDPGEAKDLAAAKPELVSELQALWDRWNAQMRPPRWEDPRWNDGNASQPQRRAAERHVQQPAARRK